MPVIYLLGERYVESLRAMAASDNAKVVLLPGDLPTAVRSIMGTAVK